MNWLDKNAPELARLTPAQQREVHRACYIRYALGTRVWFAATAVQFACAFIAALLVWVLCPWSGTHMDMWQIIIGTASGGGVGTIIRRKMVVSFLRPFYGRYVREELQQHANER